MAFIPGPYWTRLTDTEALVCGRHGKVVKRYPLDKAEAADADVAELQSHRHADWWGRHCGATP